MRKIRDYFRTDDPESNFGWALAVIIFIYSVGYLIGMAAAHLF